MAINKLNSLQRKFVRASKWKVVDESMSAWRPRTTALGGLLNISFVVQKPEDLGTDFKTKRTQRSVPSKAIFSPFSKGFH